MRRSITKHQISKSQGTTSDTLVSSFKDFTRRMGYQRSHPNSGRYRSWISWRHSCWLGPLPRELGSAASPIAWWEIQERLLTSSKVQATPRRARRVEKEKNKVGQTNKQTKIKTTKKSLNSASVATRVPWVYGMLSSTLTPSKDLMQEVFIFLTFVNMSTDPVGQPDSTAVI